MQASWKSARRSSSVRNWPRSATVVITQTISPGHRAQAKPDPLHSTKDGWSSRTSGLHAPFQAGLWTAAFRENARAAPCALHRPWPLEDRTENMAAGCIVDRQGISKRQRVHGKIGAAIPANQRWPSVSPDRHPHSSHDFAIELSCVVQQFPPHRPAEARRCQCSVPLDQDHKSH